MRHIVRWGDDVTEITRSMSATQIKKLGRRSVATIDKVVAKLGGTIVAIGPVALISSSRGVALHKDFQLFGIKFRLRYFPAKKEWLLNLASGPVTPPKTRRKKRRSAKTAARAGRKRHSATRLPGARGPRKSTQKRNVLYQLHMPAFSQATPSILRHITGMKEAVLDGAKLWSARLCGLRAALGERMRRFLLAVSRLVTNVPESALVPNFGARLEPRLFGAGLGLPLLLNTFAPIDAPSDRGVSLCGDRPEESERMLI